MHIYMQCHECKADAMVVTVREAQDFARDHKHA